MQPLHTLDPGRFETPAILKQLTRSSRQLGELKGVIASMPRQDILINTLSIQEAKDSSEIENIVTTHDELFRLDDPDELSQSAATKEVRRYRDALEVAFRSVQQHGLITINHLCEIQAALVQSRVGIRTMPGTHLRNAAGEVVYTPPQDHQEVINLMQDLERFINDDELFEADPLIKMALIHHQLESIHPFYDGNGRTGRILNVLYLVKHDLLSLPVLYLSRPLVRTKGEYYAQLQSVRDKDTWEDYVLYMLKAVESSASEAVATVTQINQAMLEAKHLIRNEHKFYSQDLINHLFSHPYTKIEHLGKALGVSRLTATKYLDALSQSGILTKIRAGRSNYYLNSALWKILVDPPEASK